MHLNEGQLRAYLDQELAERGVAAKHLATCADCRARADELARQAERIAAHLSALASAARPVSPQVALARFKSQRVRKENLSMQKMLVRFRPVIAVGGLVALLVVSLTFPPVRAWAQGVLAQFRVGKVTVVSVDSTRFEELGVGSPLTKQISQLLSDSVTMTKKPGSPKSAESAAQASALAGFAVRLATSRNDAPQITVQDSAAFQLVVNRARAQQLLNDAGASNLILPVSIDGAVVKVNIPAAVAAAYGDCPKLTEGEDAAKGSPGRTMINCIVLTEIPSPMVSAPPELDVLPLAELGLQFTGMTKEQAHAYAQTVDWTSTLVIPIPRNAAQYRQINVDGVMGYLIQRPLDDAPQYAIVWVKNGIVYAIGGVGNDTASALAMGNSLK